MKISVIGTGYVGLVTGVCLADVGHHVTCIDIDENKVNQLKKGISPIYEPGLDNIMIHNIEKQRLSFTSDLSKGLDEAQAVFIAVGTPQNGDGSADLTFIEQATKDVARNITQDTIVVTKSTVPVGTNHQIKDILKANLKNEVTVKVVSNPEFLREGSAVHDTFHGDRIVIGADDIESADIIESIYEPLGLPIVKCDICSAEMIKYAANAFLATKICFINEVASISEKFGADVSDVAHGMGLDKRIGPEFLNAGIGYGGSCFPKDTHAFVNLSQRVNHNFEMLKSAINVNNRQKTLLVDKAKERFGTLKGKKVAMLGMAFKPNTDDMREAASIPVATRLVQEGANVIAYDPVAKENAKELMPPAIDYADTIEESLLEADVVFIMTDWDDIVQKTLPLALQCIQDPVIFDGRNCYDVEHIKNYQIEYHSVGRKSVYVPQKAKVAETV